MDVSGASSNALDMNLDIEYHRNMERYTFLKWGQQSLANFQAVPPSRGIVHQVNLEFLASVARQENGVWLADTLVGTDSHTTMVNGLGVLGWGVGGIEAEAVMLGPGEIDQFHSDEESVLIAELGEMANIYHALIQRALNG